MRESRTLRAMWRGLETDLRCGSSGGDASGKTIGQVFVAVDAVVSNNTNELKTCISRSVSDRRVYACFAKGS